jgi:hypothetical protein
MEPRAATPACASRAVVTDPSGTSVGADLGTGPPSVPQRTPRLRTGPPSRPTALGRKNHLPDPIPRRRATQRAPTHFRATKPVRLRCPTALGRKEPFAGPDSSPPGHPGYPNTLPGYRPVRLRCPTALGRKNHSADLIPRRRATQRTPTHFRATDRSDFAARQHSAARTTWRTRLLLQPQHLVKARHGPHQRRLDMAGHPTYSPATAHYPKPPPPAPSSRQRPYRGGILPIPMLDRQGHRGALPPDPRGGPCAPFPRHRLSLDPSPAGRQHMSRFTASPRASPLHKTRRGRWASVRVRVQARIAPGTGCSPILSRSG